MSCTRPSYRIARIQIIEGYTCYANGWCVIEGDEGAFPQARLTFERSPRRTGGTEARESSEREGEEFHMEVLPGVNTPSTMCQKTVDPNFQTNCLSLKIQSPHFLLLPLVHHSVSPPPKTVRTITSRNLTDVGECPRMQKDSILSAYNHHNPVTTLQCILSHNLPRPVGRVTINHPGKLLKN